MFRVRIGQIALAFIVFGLLLTGLVMNFDFGVLRPTLERRLSASLGRQVRIGTLHRLDHGFHPTLRIEDLHVAQPGWAGPGDMLHIRSALVRLRLGPLLIGRVSPDSLDVDGLRLAFVRQDSTHANWRGLSSGHGGGGGGLRHIALRDAIVVLDDRKRDHRFAARVTADDRGFRLAGPGHLAGHPSHITLIGATLANPGAWPFRLDYRSAITNATLVGRADRPLDLGHFSAHATGWGNDLKSLDLLIEAGLPGTQPFRLAGDVVHTRPDWSIRGLTGSIGRSDVALSIEVKKRDGRTRLDGDFASNGLNFADLASNAGLARAAAKRAAFGPRIFPDTAIHLEHGRLHQHRRGERALRDRAAIGQHLGGAVACPEPEAEREIARLVGGAGQDEVAQPRQAGQRLRARRAPCRSGSFRQSRARSARRGHCGRARRPRRRRRRWRGHS
jgi:hypothetical protein